MTSFTDLKLLSIKGSYKQLMSIGGCSSDYILMQSKKRLQIYIANENSLKHQDIF